MERFVCARASRCSSLDARSRRLVTPCARTPDLRSATRFVPVCFGDIIPHGKEKRLRIPQALRPLTPSSSFVSRLLPLVVRRGRQSLGYLGCVVKNILRRCSATLWFSATCTSRRRTIGAGRLSFLSRNVRKQPWVTLQIPYGCVLLACKAVWNENTEAESDRLMFNDWFNSAVTLQIEHSSLCHAIHSKNVNGVVNQRFVWVIGPGVCLSIGQTKKGVTALTF